MMYGLGSSPQDFLTQAGDSHMKKIGRAILLTTNRLRPLLIIFLGEKEHCNKATSFNKSRPPFTIHRHRGHSKT